MAKTKSKRVLLTREDNAVLADILAEAGFDVLEIPLIKITLESDASDVKDVFNEMGRYDWLTFSSVNGVRGFFKEFLKHFEDIRSLGFSRIACVGESTAKELKKYFLHSDVIPQISTGEEMGKAMAEYESLENLKILCIIGNLAGKGLFDVLEKNNAIVDALEVYKTEGAMVDSTSSAVKDFRKGGADVIVFASPSAVESFVKNVDNLSLSSSSVKPKIVSIGPRTSEAVKKYGMKVAIESATPYPQDVLKAIETVS